jgi:hypothetical protein
MTERQSRWQNSGTMSAVNGLVNRIRLWTQGTI